LRPKRLETDKNCAMFSARDHVAQKTLAADKAMTDLGNMHYRAAE